MTAVNLVPFHLNGPAAHSSTFVVGYPAGSVQADFTGGNASATGSVAVNDNEIYTEAESEVALSYGASSITVQNLSGQTWPAGAQVRVQAAFTTTSEGGSGGSISAATLVALVAEAAAHGTLGPSLGEHVDAALATRTDAEMRAALIGRHGIVLADGEEPAEDDVLGGAAVTGEAKVIPSVPVV